jgi:hypothetical protein
MTRPRFNEFMAYQLATSLYDVVDVEVFDTSGRQGVVDAILTLADGRRASFEVTMLPNTFMEARKMVAQDAWPPAGKWMWSASGASARELRQLRGIYAQIIDVCEGAGFDFPHFLYEDRPDLVDDNIRWLVERSGCQLVGSPDMPSLGRRVSVGLSGKSEVGPHDSDALDPLRAAFKQDVVQAHITKAGTPHPGEGHIDERHLFVWIMPGTLPPSSEGLFVIEDDESLPNEPPGELHGVTHLWLAHWAWWRILRWHDGHWSLQCKPGSPSPVKVKRPGDGPSSS